VIQTTLTELSAHNELDIGHQFVVEHGCIPLENRRLAGLPVGIRRIDGVGSRHGCEMPVCPGGAHVRSTATGWRGRDAATAAAAELEGRQKAVGLPEMPPPLPAPPPLLLLLLFRAPGEANGEDGALMGCVIWIL